jgi:hypothetical protein
MIILSTSRSKEDYEKLILLRQLSDKAVRENNESAFLWWKMDEFSQEKLPFSFPSILIIHQGSSAME